MGSLSLVGHLGGRDPCPPDRRPCPPDRRRQHEAREEYMAERARRPRSIQHGADQLQAVPPPVRRRVLGHLHLRLYFFRRPWQRPEKRSPRGIGATREARASKDLVLRLA